MRILYFSPRECSPPNNGGRLRDFHLARQLALSHDVTYLGFTVDSDALLREINPALGCSSILVPRQRSYAKLNLARGLLGPRPLTVWNYVSAEMRAELNRLLAGPPFDAVQVEGVHLLSYLDTLENAPGRPAIICDWHNIEAELMARRRDQAASFAHRWYAARSATLLDRAEQEILARCRWHLVCSEREQKLLQARSPQADISVIGNGVDIPSDPLPETDTLPNSIVFVGSMDYEPNIDGAVYFVREVWPLLSSAVPDLRLTIVGSRPTERVRALASDRIEVTGTVDDVLPYYRSALATIIPLRIGGGTRLKALESMAQGVPVLSTSLGVEGIQGIVDGKTALLADTPDAMVQAILRLKGNPALWRDLALAGRELVRAAYDWNAIGEILRRCYDRVLGER